jgi:hypothetical protein
LNSGSSPWPTPLALFLWRVFPDRVSWTICLGWLRTAIILISASWVARIAGVSHLCLSYSLLVPKYGIRHLVRAQETLAKENLVLTGYWWLTPIILPTWEAEIRRIMVLGQAGQTVRETLSWK